MSAPLIGCAMDGAHLEMRGAAPLGASDAASGAGASVVATSPLPEPRGQHAAALLPTGKVLVFGGRAATVEGGPPFDWWNEYSSLTSAALFDPATETWTRAAPAPRSLAQSAPHVVLQDGRVLAMTGGWEAALYDPALDAWTAPAPMPTHRTNYGVAPLPDGRVLVAGGRLTTSPSWPPTPAAEIYDPVADTWVDTTSMSVANEGPLGAVSLLDGRVLVVGTFGHAELYDPASETWAQSLPRSSGGTRMTLLSSGKVLVVGREGQSEVYDPATNAWTSAGGLDTSGKYASEVLTPLPGGRALLTGGMWHDSNDGIDEDGWPTCGGPIDCLDFYGFTDAVWLFDPITQSWAAALPMALPRAGHTATLLPSGTVLIAGGDVPDDSTIVHLTTDAVELYVPQGLRGLPPGAPCDTNDACASGSCADGRCCDGACGEQGGDGRQGGGAGGFGGGADGSAGAAGGPDGEGGAPENGAGGEGGSASHGSGGDPGSGASNGGDSTGGLGCSAGDIVADTFAGNGCSMGGAGDGHRPWCGAVTLLVALGLRRKGRR
ncbi:Kelch repeat-containing protein [Sorangium sp. So ce128]|uniref:Kelch repeat-containing protein n=1 Tax=Sorangium sp. So ce128 TaxID=3133281 RepID=UPI003F63ED0B